MDLDVSDVEELFQMLDAGGDGRLSAEELVVGVGKLRGAARAMDLRRRAHFDRLSSVFSLFFTGFSGGSVFGCWEPLGT